MARHLSVLDVAPTLAPAAQAGSAADESGHDGAGKPIESPSDQIGNESERHSRFRSTPSEIGA